MDILLERFKDELVKSTKEHVLASNRYDAAIVALTTKFVDGAVFEQIRTLESEADQAYKKYQEAINKLIEWHQVNRK